MSMGFATALISISDWDLVTSSNERRASAIVPKGANRRSAARRATVGTHQPFACVSQPQRAPHAIRHVQKVISSQSTLRAFCIAEPSMSSFALTPFITLCAAALNHSLPPI
eukprot:scaffold910_cov396-Prasinococcus_capsulatus_cf.AAC.38